MPKHLTCASCARYSPRKQYPQGEAWGECRIAAPLKSTVDGNGQPLVPSEPHWGAWPAVHPYDWCDQHSLTPVSLGIDAGAG